MLIRSSELEVPLDAPFEHDKLQRDELEEPLTQFINQSIGPFVLAIDGSWGSGKTTFLRMWKAKLISAGHACLYLNAWKTDFAQEPLIAVVGELSETIENFAPNGEEKKKLHEGISNIQKLAKSIAKRSIPLAAKIATFGILETHDAAAMMEKVISDFVGDVVEDRIKEYEEGKSEIEEFRSSLSALADEVATLKPDLPAKVVIIIDELDRCRPTYAVQLLERMKHLFDVPGVIFILGIDRSQLCHSIRALYGSEFNARGYLKRFIDLDYRLPEANEEKYCSYLFERFGIEEIILKRKNSSATQELKDLKKTLGSFLLAAKMSLREQEQVVARLRIVLQTIPISSSLNEFTLAFLLFLREWNHDLYADVLAGRRSISEILNEFNQLPGPKNFAGMGIDFVEAILISGLSELGFSPPQMQNYLNLASSSGVGGEADKARRILKIIEGISRPGVGDVGFRVTEKRLALTSPFVLYDKEE